MWGCVGTGGGGDETDQAPLHLEPKFGMSGGELYIRAHIRYYGMHTDNFSCTVS
jgi:hypothetical protein